MSNASLLEDCTSGMLHEGVTKLEVSSITTAEGSMVPVDVHHITAAGTPGICTGNRACACILDVGTLCTTSCI